MRAPDGGIEALADRISLHDKLSDLVSLLLQTTVPVGPMRSRKDYPPELRRAIDYLRDTAEGRRSAVAVAGSSEAAKPSATGARFEELLKAALDASYECGDWNEKGEDREPYDDYCKKLDAATNALRAFVAPFLPKAAKPRRKK